MNVNNAGYRLLGPLEDLIKEEKQKNCNLSNITFKRMNVVQKGPNRFSSTINLPAHLSNSITNDNCAYRAVISLLRESSIIHICLNKDYEAFRKRADIYAFMSMITRYEKNSLLYSRIGYS
jgi:hypothetical protein